MNQTPLTVALIGMGTVGTGVARILLEHSERLARRAGRPISLRRVVVQNIDKPRDVALPNGLLTDDPSRVLNDPEIDVVVQLIGGIEPARSIMRLLIESGKDVVTANKALLCEHGEELFDYAHERNRTISFEAAVAGGIPIIAVLGCSLASNQITSIEAILNGTSNFILTQMLATGRPYREVLRHAQKLGYAEADPTMDVDGTDTAQKLVILTQLAFGTKVALSEFTRGGIADLELADLRYARELGYTVKLLAVSRLVNGNLEMHVQPTLVHRDRPLAKVDGAFNMLALEGDCVGTTWFAGPGAGQMPTASAVTADLIDVATGRASRTFRCLDVWHEQPPISIQPAAETANRYYLRFNVLDRPGVFAEIADILGRCGISLASIIQHESPEPADQRTDAKTDEVVVHVVVMTHRTPAGRLLAADQALDALESLRPPRIQMPVAD